MCVCRTFPARCRDDAIRCAEFVRHVSKRNAQSVEFYFFNFPENVLPFAKFRYKIIIIITFRYNTTLELVKKYFVFFSLSKRARNACRLFRAVSTLRILRSSSATSIRVFSRVFFFSLLYNRSVLSSSPLCGLTVFCPSSALNCEYKKPFPLSI